jgi:hypothetical protein
MGDKAVYLISYVNFDFIPNPLVVFLIKEKK